MFRENAFQQQTLCKDIKKLLSLQNAGTGRLNPVVPPGLTLSRPLCAYYHMLTVVNGVSAPARILENLSARPQKPIHQSDLHRHPTIGNSLG